MEINNMHKQFFNIRKYLEKNIYTISIFQGCLGNKSKRNHKQQQIISCLMVLKTQTLVINYLRTMQ